MPKAKSVAHPARGVARPSRPALGTRRAFLASGLSAGVLASLTTEARAANAVGEVTPGPAPKPYRSPTLVERITYYPTDEEMNLFNTLGHNGYIDYHLNYTAIQDTECDMLLQAYPQLIMSPIDLANSDGAVVQAAFESATLLRAVKSKRQLYEKMVEFWTDHFNIHYAQVGFYKLMDDRDAIRPHALGKFKDLLMASAKSPAMIIYLNNNTNRLGAPNQNYTREVYELHCLGVDNGYTQQDIAEGARCFTGWNYDSRTLVNNLPNPLFGTFRFISGNHDQGTKTVLGNFFAANGGLTDGERLIDILANHPNTARFIVTKLWRWFIGNEPTTAQVSAIAQVFTNTQGDIKEVVRAVLNRANFVGAKMKFKRPFHMVASIMRSANVATSNWATIAGTHLQLMGHRPFQWAPPDGYPDKESYWSGLILPRWNFAFSLMNGNVNSTTVDINATFSSSTVRTTFVNAVINKMRQAHLGDGAIKLLMNYKKTATLTTIDRQEIVALAFANTDFQRY